MGLSQENLALRFEKVLTPKIMEKLPVGVLTDVIEVYERAGRAERLVEMAKKNRERGPVKRKDESEADGLSSNKRGMVEEFTKHVTRMNEVIYKAVAKCMNLEEDCFLTSQGNKEEITARFSFYPRCPFPDKVQGFPRHADGTTISINLADTEGLEVLNNDQWYKVPVIPGALFVNIGHLGEVMSNGVFKSAVHRVITNSEKERTSVVAFCHPEKLEEIGPVSEFVRAHTPQKFRSFNFITEYKANYLNDYVLGRSPVEAFKF
ncbi:codeine O-demethylase-like [Silene latifolia]|uniref:codeine O-demethylase-like n=1 Tax=Silene latifolia TaxID=37657 RepID=UPI003D76EE4A